jgi:hypothetical protein
VTKPSDDYPKIMFRPQDHLRTIAENVRLQTVPAPWKSAAYYQLIDLIDLILMAD